MQSFHVIIVVVVLIFILVSLYKEIFKPAYTFFISVALLGLTGVLTAEEILRGFANKQIMIIMILLFLGDIIRRTYVIEIVFDRIFRGANSYKSFMLKMMGVVASFSAFLNNTPIVAVMMPYVHNWSKKNNISPSKLLIPLSYAAILGGCATLIGTSTNLIVNGLWIDQQIFPGQESLDLFHFAWVGIPMIVIGIAFLVIFGNRLLPDRKETLDEFSVKKREYIIEAGISKGSDLIGKSIEEAGLRNLKSLFLVEIIRDRQSLKAIPPDTVLLEGDFLMFAGDTDTIVDLTESKIGLSLPVIEDLDKVENSEIVEIVISHNSYLIGKTVKEANFRGKYGAAIIAIHRNGERVSGKIGKARLKAGDVLLLKTSGDFLKHAEETHDFYFISKLKEIHNLNLTKVSLLLGGTFLAIILSAFKIIPLFIALIVLLVILMLTKVTSGKDLQKAFDYNLFVIIALAMPFGIAMQKTGVAEFMAEYVIKLLLPLGTLGLLFGIYFITSLLAAYITYVAAVALVFPISITMAYDLGLNPIPFVLIVASAAAANFITPIGYQTNLMVYGSGGYKFKDFFKVGFPLTIIYMIVAVFILNSVYL